MFNLQQQIFFMILQSSYSSSPPHKKKKIYIYFYIAHKQYGIKENNKESLQIVGQDKSNNPIL
jgi:hypothetical protein